MGRRGVLAGALIALASIGLPARAAPGDVSIVAGGEADLGVGDGGAAMSAAVYPFDMAADGRGDLYFTQDTGNDNSWVRMIDAGGTVRTVHRDAGAGRPGIAVTSDGTLYFSAPAQHRVFRRSFTGTTELFAGDGTAGSLGDGGLATSAELGRPGDLAVDASGNVYITDYDQARIRKVAPDGIITTLAGTGRQGDDGDGGQATLASVTPFAITVAPDGAVYFSEGTDATVRRVRTDGVIERVAGGGTNDPVNGGRALDASFTSEEGQGPVQIAVTGSGDLLVSDAYARVYRVAVDGTISVFAGSGSRAHIGDGEHAIDAGLGQPVGLAPTEDGSVYVGEWTGLYIRKVDPAGTISTIAGIGEYDVHSLTGPATFWQLGSIALHDGLLYAADSGHRRVAAVNLATHATSNYVGSGYGGDPGLYLGPATAAALPDVRAVATGSDGTLYLAEGSPSHIYTVDPTGDMKPFAGFGACCVGVGPALSASFDDVSGLGIDAAGDVFVLSFAGHLFKISDGISTLVAGDAATVECENACLPLPCPPTGCAPAVRGAPFRVSLSEPSGLAVAPDGTAYVSDSGNGRVLRITSDGTVTRLAGIQGHPSGFFGSGCPAPATLPDVATHVDLCQPSSIALAPDGSVVFADPPVGRVVRIDPSGTMTLLAGSEQSCPGSTVTPGTSATDAHFCWISGLAIDASGDLFVANTGDVDVIYKIETSL